MMKENVKLVFKQKWLEKTFPNTDTIQKRSAFVKTLSSENTKQKEPAVQIGTPEWESLMTKLTSTCSTSKEENIPLTQNQVEAMESLKAYQNFLLQHLTADQEADAEYDPKDNKY